MALYLVIHTPGNIDSENSQPPSRLLDLAHSHSSSDSAPRWLKSWSPDLHDDRIFSLWDSINAAAIQQTLNTFGYLDDMDSDIIHVREWGPEDVIAAHREGGSQDIAK